MRTQTFKLSLIALAIYGAHSASAATWSSQDLIESETKSNTAPHSTEQQDSGFEPSSREQIERIQVTGSRLQFGDVTARSITINAEEIRARGVTSVAELMRTLPQNISNIGAITNERQKGSLNDRGPASVTGIGSLGVSAANLGGMGAGNTLILINGRRMAGAAGIEDGFVNLNGIPLSAIERVEIHTDGASAVYGSDALGGVINFILKKDYVGSTFSAQKEYSNNGADNSRLSLYSGYAWTSGSISGTADYSERKPVNNYKTGYYTEDYSGYFNDNPDYDKRSFSRGLQPGVINQTESFYNPDTGQSTTVERGLSVPEGFVGRPSVSDFIELGSEDKPDFVPELAGPETETTSLTLNLEQQLTENLIFSGNGLFSRSKNRQEQTFATGLTIQLAPGQYYNPFPAYSFSSWEPATTVNYSPDAEIQSGTLPADAIMNESQVWNLNLGLTYEFSKDSKLDFVYTTSASKTEGEQFFLGSTATFIRDESSPDGYRCYNFQLENNRFEGEELTYYQDLFERQCAALMSQDPDVAFNPWKSGGAGDAVNTFYYRDIQENETRGSQTKNFELRFISTLAELPAGKVYYAIGGELHDDGISSREVRNYTGEKVSRDRYAYFAEFNIPVFGAEFNTFLIDGLTFNIAARRDTYETEGAVGTIDDVPIEQGGEIIYGTNKYSKTTPSFGFLWEVNDDLAIRGKWNRGFKAPPFTQMFSTTGERVYNVTIYDDPLYDCTNDCDVVYDDGTKGYNVPQFTAPNPDLKPETSIQRSLGLSWRPSNMISGFSADINYSETTISDEFASNGTLNRFLTTDEIYQLGEFFPRDENGKITRQQNMIFNVVGSKYASITYEARYALNTSFGNFDFEALYLDNLKAEMTAFENKAPISDIGKLLGVDDYKINGTIRYHYDDLTVNLLAYFTPEYINDYELNMYGGVIDVPENAKKVSSYTTIDLTMMYQLTDDLRVNFAGRNIFDKEPPFVVVQRRPYDTARYNVAGRTLALELQYEF
ncbi:TonB-dependent receptor [Idiomarina sp. M1R2S28]|uniref:TonB-dependent receptor n=1 Tax=Idiomarina rhizosphaerae TaxID=2961572 RepID=A0A9X2FVC7_9GAMM|nr:TonB-dependent receptor [Idiomarina rhizosphaerae]MCP1338320.1 TonB-dependent receptor [Idiomarina rhizosphaerae]